MRAMTRIPGTLASILFVAFVAGTPLPAQTSPTAYSTNTWSAGDSTLGADFTASLASTRASFIGTYYYQAGSFGVTGHALGQTFPVLSGQFTTWAYQGLGAQGSASSNVLSTLTLPGGFTWTPFNQALTTSGQSTSTVYASLIPLFHMSASYPWWVFTVSVGIDGNLAADSSLLGCHMGMAGDGTLNSLAGTMRTGIGITVSAQAGFSINLLVASAGVTVTLSVTPVAGGIEMPYYLDPLQVSSNLNLVMYGQANITITAYWTLFWFFGDSYTWSPWSPTWNYGTVCLLRNGIGVPSWTPQPMEPTSWTTAVPYTGPSVPGGGTITGTHTMMN